MLKNMIPRNFLVGLSRAFSTGPSQVESFRFADMKVEHATELGTPSFDPKDLAFGHTHTDHMAHVFFDGEKWGNPGIIPFQPIPVDPFNSTLHYGLTCFEGMKAYWGVDGKIRMIRPWDNMARLSSSMGRLAMDSPWENEELTKVIAELLRMDVRWFPKELGHSMYIRPFAMSTTKTLGVQPPKNYGIFVCLNPVASYFGATIKPINVAILNHFERTTPRSAGAYKLGSNYAPALQPMVEWQKKGYHQVLWTYGDTICEVGACNIFFVIRTPSGERELITPELDGSILPGITRKTLLEFFRDDQKNINPKVDRIVEKNLRISEVQIAFNEGRVEECFGAGTAVTVVPVGKICIHGTEFELPISEEDVGKVTNFAYQSLIDLQYGRVKSPLQYLVN